MIISSLFKLRLLWVLKVIVMEDSLFKKGYSTPTDIISKLLGEKLFLNWRGLKNYLILGVESIILFKASAVSILKNTREVSVISISV